VKGLPLVKAIEQRCPPEAEWTTYQVTVWKETGKFVFCLQK